jgi:hypothetical protein
MERVARNTVTRRERGDAAVGMAGLLEPGRDIEIAFWIDPPGLPRKDLRKC